MPVSVVDLVATIACGLHTVSYAWQAAEDARVLGDRLKKRHGGPRGSVWGELMPGVQAGFFANGLVVGEGALGCCLGVPGGASHLYAPSRLDEGASTVARAFAVLGLALDSPSLRRCDPAADVCFPCGDSGRALLRAVAGATFIGKRKIVYLASTEVAETVNLKTAKRGTPIARVYDASLHHETGGAGTRLRLETTFRRSGQRRPVLGEQPVEWVRDVHLKPFSHWLGSASLTVANPEDARARIFALLARGAITPTVAMNRAGFIDAIEQGVDPKLLGQGYGRRVRALRELGIETDALDGPRTIALDLVPLAQAIAAAWSAPGAPA